MPPKAKRGKKAKATNAPRNPVHSVQPPPNSLTQPSSSSSVTAEESKIIAVEEVKAVNNFSVSEAKTANDSNASEEIRVAEEIKEVPQKSKRRIRERPEEFEGVYPPRPSLKKDGSKIVSLTTNSYIMKLTELKCILVYSVKFSDNVTEDNTPLKKLLLKKLRADVEKIFTTYLFSGNNIFAPKDIGEDPVMLQVKEQSSDYTVTILKVSSICVDDIMGHHKDAAKVQTVQTFLNLVVKSLLSGCNMHPVGRTNRYLLPAEVKAVENYPLEIWPGYYTVVNLYEDGLMLEIDYASRVLRQESVYEFMQRVKKRNPGNWKEAVNKAIVGNSVLVRYGTMRGYTIESIRYDLTPANKKIEDKEDVNLVEYYKKKYLIKIKDTTQPLLFASKTNKDQTVREIYLVPELCSLTGLPEELLGDRSTLQKLAVHTKLSPDQRKYQAEILLKKFLALKSMMKNWNLTITIAPHEIRGRLLKPQTLTTGKSDLPVHESGQFLLKEQIVKPVHLKKWILVYTSRDEEMAERFVDLLYTAAKTFGIAVDYPIYAESRGESDASLLGALKYYLKECANPDVVVFLLPPVLVNAYTSIKRFAITYKPMLLTQVVKTKSLRNPKNQMSICAKIVLQINAKKNATLWTIKVPSQIPKLTMVVGIDTSKESKYHCLAMSSSYDLCFTKYYTQAIKVTNDQRVATSIGNQIVNALKQFQSKNSSSLPELIVIYRDGLTDRNRSGAQIGELKAVYNSIQQNFDNYKPKLTFALINKKLHTRFYMKASNSKTNKSKDSVLANPQAGTIVDTGIVDPRRYEFLIMPQHVNEGTGMPSRITVLYDSSKLPIAAFEELTNALCYGYYNWQGAIRTPAPCKYAFTHARFVSKYVQCNVAEELFSMLYFL
eukprot:TRINITY_DN2371_c0_g1_i2.p1 TRINITY_DN2371_c0_g1~~TRINITY_DN2371_c0_g1_i2.p1  ORF type:complete len:887 (-),score=199.48 TRINITY_DN2371_c0_g1_i2:104-2764(-)